MIGQRNIQIQFNDLIESNKLPRFIILVGQRGSGRKTLMKSVAKQLGAIVVQIETKADSIREMIEQAYKVAVPTMFIIADADNMSSAATNAMLKVTEEPPNNAYFVLTLQDEMQTIDTIRSRGTVFHMDSYRAVEIKQFVGESDEYTMRLFTDICETPYEVQLLKQYGIKEFTDYVKLVIDNIAVVSGSNAFKIGNKIALSADSDGFDLRLFWKAFSKMCLERAKESLEDAVLYLNAILITNKYIAKLHISSLNKQYLFDMWILDIRREWM